MKPGRLISPPGTYFATFSTWQRRRLFLVENYVRLFLKILYCYRREGRYQLHAFVVMPEHVHLLLTPGQDVTLEHAIQLIAAIPMRSEVFLGESRRSGSVDSLTTASAITRISRTI